MLFTGCQRLAAIPACTGQCQEGLAPRKFGGRTDWPVPASLITPLPAPSPPSAHTAVHGLPARSVPGNLHSLPGLHQRRAPGVCRHRSGGCSQHRDGQQHDGIGCSLGGRQQPTHQDSVPGLACHQVGRAPASARARNDGPLQSGCSLAVTTASSCKAGPGSTAGSTAAPPRAPTCPAPAPLQARVLARPGFRGGDAVVGRLWHDLF